eukprot:COSAG02_NODE_2392_length_8974_cov_2.135437_8_plen_179_part_00
MGQYRPCSLLSCFRSWLGVQVNASRSTVGLERHAAQRRGRDAPRPAGAAVWRGSRPGPLTTQQGDGAQPGPARRGAARSRPNYQCATKQRSLHIALGRRWGSFDVAPQPVWWRPRLVQQSNPHKRIEGQCLALERKSALPRGMHDMGNKTGGSILFPKHAGQYEFSTIFSIPNFRVEK